MDKVIIKKIEDSVLKPHCQRDKHNVLCAKIDESSPKIISFYNNIKYYKIILNNQDTTHGVITFLNFLD